MKRGGWHAGVYLLIRYLFHNPSTQSIQPKLSLKKPGESYLFTHHLLQRLLPHLTTNTPRSKRIPLTEHIFDFFQGASCCFGEHEENVECGADVEDAEDKVGDEPL